MRDTIIVRGFNPNSACTVWLANEKTPRELSGVGIRDYSFRTDSSGNGSYTAAVNKGDLRNSRMIEVARHPDGDPTNLRDAEVVPRGRIKE